MQLGPLQTSVGQGCREGGPGALSSISPWLAAPLTGVSDQVSIKLYPQAQGTPSLISWLQACEGGEDRPQGHQADEMLKSCPKCHDDKKVGPKEARVHSGRDVASATPHYQPPFPPVSFISQQGPGEVGQAELQ